MAENYLHLTWKAPHKWESPGVLNCTVCGASFGTVPRGGCPEKPWYRDWSAVPDSLVTRTMAKRLNVRIGLEPDAYVSGSKKVVICKLFRVPDSVIPMVAEARGRGAA